MSHYAAPCRGYSLAGAGLALALLAAMALGRPAAAVRATGATLSLEPSPATITVTQALTLSLVLDTGGGPASGVAACLRFDPRYVQIESLEPDPVLPQVLLTEVDNRAGTLRYEAGRLESPVAGRMTVARLQLRARAATPPAGTWLRFGSSGLATTDVVYGGGSILAATYDGCVRVEPPGGYRRLWLPLAARP